MLKFDAEHISLIATEEQRNNLRRLFEYLKGNLQADCGTVGCVVSHGPYAGIPRLENEDRTAYRARSFSPSFSWDSDFMFSLVWAFVYNTAVGAASRIDYGAPFESNLSHQFLQEVTDHLNNQK